MSAETFHQLPDDHSTIRKLTSPNDESNWDPWSFAMTMMLRGRNLDYVIEGAIKHGFTSFDQVPEAVIRADNCTVSSIITARMMEENFPLISSVAHSARAMWGELRAAHQNVSAGSRYMYLGLMMAEKAVDDDDVGQLLGRMDTVRQKLRAQCSTGNVSFDNVYISLVIAALPDSWTAVTALLKLQTTVTIPKITAVLRGNIVKIKNKEAHMIVSPGA